MVHLVYHAKLSSIHSKVDKIFDHEFKKLLQESNVMLQSERDTKQTLIQQHENQLRVLSTRINKRDEYIQRMLIRNETIRALVHIPLRMDEYSHHVNPDLNEMKKEWERQEDQDIPMSKGLY